jgi:hypothetical protein
LPGPPITFNVVFTPGSAARLLPFSLSLLQSPQVRLRLVANASGQGEVGLMRAVAERDDRVSSYVLPLPSVVDHGESLTHLFEAFPEPHFAFADSDVIAGGDFMENLWPLAPGQAGVFAASSVWASDEEAFGTPRTSVLSGGKHTLHDGTFVGSSYCAIYDRSAVEAVWEGAPRGFAGHHSHMIPESVRAALSARGWSFRTLDTARLINLQLLLAGYELEGRATSVLYHVGGFSIRDFGGSRGAMVRVAAVLKSGPGHRLRRIANGVLGRLYFTYQRDPTLKRRRRRRSIVLPYLDAVLDAIAAGKPLPPAPKTDLPRVDRQVAELVTVLEDQYPRGLEAVREATRTPTIGIGAD